MADVIPGAAPAADAENSLLPEQVRLDLQHFAGALDYAERHYAPGADEARCKLDEAVRRLDRALLEPQALDFDRFTALFGCRPNLTLGHVILGSIERVTGAKPRALVQRLMAEWLTDPIWDVHETEGFEAYADELRALPRSDPADGSGTDPAGKRPPQSDSWPGGGRGLEAHWPKPAPASLAQRPPGTSPGEPRCGAGRGEMPAPAGRRLWRTARHRALAARPSLMAQASAPDGGRAPVRPVSDPCVLHARLGSSRHIPRQQREA